MRHPCRRSPDHECTYVSAPSFSSRPKDPGPWSTPPRRRRRLGLVLALIVLAVLVVIGAVLAHRHTSDNAPTPDAVTATATSPVASPPANPAPVDAGSLTSPPTGVTWQTFRGLALPVSPSAGPAHRDGPVLHGYARTPAGALIAAAQISARYLITSGDGWRQVLAEQVMPGPGREAFTVMRAGLSDQVPGAGFAQFAGFKFLAYTPDLAVLSLANRAPAGTLTVTNTTVHWSGGDWKVEIAPSGLAQPQAVGDLDGYVLWSASS